MRVSLLIVLEILFSFNLAWANTTLFNQGPTPQQSYISGNTVNSVNSSNRMNNSSNPMNPDNVTRHSQNKLTAMPMASGQQQNVDQITSPITPRTAAINKQTMTPELHELQAQLSELNQLGLLFQQRTDQRLETLTSQNTQMQNKIKELAMAIGLLNQEITQLSKTTAVQQGKTNLEKNSGIAETMNISQVLDFIVQQSGTIIIVLLSAILLAVIVLILVNIRRLRKSHNPQYAIENAPKSISSSAIVLDEDDTKSEYDFMNSNEAIPAKLDLARAYLDMEDYRSAREALNQVMSEGNRGQRLEAETMLNKIPHNL
jgi:FimV-like protein